MDNNLDKYCFEHYSFFTIEMNIRTCGNKNRINMLLFGYSVENSYMKSFLCLTYSISNKLFLYMSINIFDFYYVMICLDISSLLEVFQQKLKFLSNYDYKHLTNMYNEISLIADFFDKTAGFLIFQSFLYSVFLCFMS